MAKAKNKRNSGLADKVHNTKKGEASKKKLNPFEVHINREKLKVLGKKSKHDRGLPGVSRAKAIQKRKETLGTEMKLMNKTNTFIDRRIGERNAQLTSEDRLIARFAAERVKQHSKKNIYNLADDEILTHRGQTLEQIEKFDDPRSSDEEDEDGRKFGGLDDEFVSEGHFGGGVLSKTDSKDGAKSHKDLIEQLIAESKKRKAEKQKEKEQTMDLTEKLDSEWKDLQPVVFKRPRLEDKNEEPSIIDKLLSQAEKKAQDYDKTMRELKFEKRGTPSDGLKSEDQLAMEEKQRVDKLVKERDRRMFDEDSTVHPTQVPGKHRSADDLDDNFELDDEPNFMLAYDKDGKPLVPEHIFKESSVGGGKNNQFDEGVLDTSGDENEESDDENDDDSDENGEKRNISEENAVGETIGLFSGINDDEEKEENDTEPDEDKTCDSEEDEESDDDETENESEKESILDNLDDLKHSDKESDVEPENDDLNDKIVSFFDLEIGEKENLKELLSDKTPLEQSSVLDKLIKKYNPSLAENNKEKLGRLYAHLLQYINNIFTNLNHEDEVKNAFTIFSKISPYLYDLAHINIVKTKNYLMELITKKHEQFKKNKKRVPDLDTLIFFKLVSFLYPASDHRHPVVTPCFVFMTEILRKCHFRDTYSISRGLFLTTLILEYTILSKRYVPAAINFLRGILFISANTSILNPVQVVPPFRLHKEQKILILERNCNKMEVENKMAARDLVTNTANDDFKIRSLLVSVDILKHMFDYFNDMEAQQCIFEPHIQLLSRIDLDLYPIKVCSKLTETMQYMKQNLEVKTYKPLTREKKRFKMLRLYEPDVQEVFTGSKSAKLTRDQAERDKLKHKYKREMKGALREIRRDKAYIASVKIKHKIHSDNIRKEKVKQIFKDASIQQGELNKFKRMK